MVALKGTTVKNDFKNICNRAYNGEPIIVSRPKEENVVLVSEKDYTSLINNVEYLTKLLNSFNEIKNGETTTLSVKEMELLANG